MSIERKYGSFCETHGVLASECLSKPASQHRIVRDDARTTSDRDEWTRGYAAAIAAVQRLYRESTIAKQVAICDGFDLDKFAAAGVEDFDLIEIRRAWKHG